MAYRRKAWQEKLQDKQDLPKILGLQMSFPCYNTAIG